MAKDLDAQVGPNAGDWAKSNYPKVYEAIRSTAFDIYGIDKDGQVEVGRQCRSFKAVLEKYISGGISESTMKVLHGVTEINRCPTGKEDVDAWMACWRADWISVYSVLQGGPTITRSKAEPYKIICSCSNPKIITHEFDEMENTSTVTNSGYIFIKANKKQMLGIYFYKDDWYNSAYTFGFKVIGAGCIDGSSRVIFLFEDGTRLEDSNDLDFNCDNDLDLHLNYDPKDDLVFNDSERTMLLLTKRIKAIRAYTDDSSVEVQLTKKQQDQVKDTFHCFIAKIQAVLKEVKSKEHGD